MEHVTRDATAEDAIDIAKLYYLAGKSHVDRSIYDLMIPGPPGMTEERIEAIAKIASTEAPSWLNLSHYKVIEVDGKVASGLATFTTEEAGGRQLGQAMMEAGWGVKDLLSMGRRLRVWSGVDPGREHGYLVVENVATFDGFRDNGFSAELLAMAIESAREQGLKGLQLTVLLGNDPAIRVYEKAGFELVKSKESKKFNKVFTSPGAGQMLLKF